MAIEYLGSKAQLIDFVVAPMLALDDVATVVDVFCGTASVSRALAEGGRRVIANDHLHLCATLAEAELLGGAAPRFDGLRDAVPRRPGEPVYEAVLHALDAAAPVAGFFWTTYSPAGGRMYLTEANARRVDGMREQIARWEPLLARGERALLLRDLVRAVARVSNTAGTYGCYLKAWKARALEPVALVPLARAPLPSHGHEVHRRDAGELLDRVDGDLIYLDPPYTKRQHAAYYHLLETLVSGERPPVTGSTGLPPWQARGSDFCHARRAAAALAALLARVHARHVFLSYSEDGHLAHETILDLLGAHGAVRWWQRPTRRYRSHGRGAPRSPLHERLYACTLAA